MDLTANHFELFALPVRFELNRTALDQAYRAVQAEVHPDRFAHASAVEQRVSMQWATRANEAYQTLKLPLARAKYLVELKGGSVDAERNTAMPPEFLMAQMEWREEAEDARNSGDLAALEALRSKLDDTLREAYAELAVLLDARGDVAAAAGEVRKLMFFERMGEELDDAIADLEDAL